MDPLFWLGFSILLVAVSLTAVLITLLPAVRELARAARSAEKLFDTLSRELPPTLEAIRLTGMEITDLTDDVSEGVQSAGQLVKHVDHSLTTARHQIQQAHVNTRSAASGFRAAWRVFFQKPPSKNRNRTSQYRASESYDSMNSHSPERDSSAPLPFRYTDVEPQTSQPNDQAAGPLNDGMREMRKKAD
jgi:uncharacterized protein YoxC